MRAARLLALAVVLVAPLAPAPAAVAAQAPVGVTTRVSADLVGGRPDGPSTNGTVSADGRFVSFESEAPDITAPADAATPAVYVRDRRLLRTTRVSVSSSGVPANGASGMPDISADGRFVAFVSSATNLVASDTNGLDDVFLHDRVRRTTVRVNVRSSGAQATGGPSRWPAVSSDGRYVAFWSLADNLVSGDTNRVADVFLRDTKLGLTRRVSVASSGAEGNEGSGFLDLSGDGLRVVFVSRASNLVAGDTQGGTDVFLHDVVDRNTTMVSVDRQGGPASSDSDQPSISQDGRRVVFLSSANDLVLDDTNGKIDVFLRDLDEAETVRVNLSGAGAQADDQTSDAAISGDGKRVAFSSWAANLVPGDTTESGIDVFVRDVAAGTTRRVSVTTAGGQANSYSTGAAPDADGSVVAFTSWANNLSIGGTVEHDAYVRDVAAPPSPFGDVSLDGLVDVLARDTRTGGLDLYRGTGNGLAGPVRIGASGWNGMSEIIRGRDVDGDGREDVLARETATGRLYLYPGRHAGLGPRALVGASGWGARRELVVPGDVDRDGRVDLLAVSRPTGQLLLYPGRANGFGAPRVVGDRGWNGMSELIGFGDLTGNGVGDLVARQDDTGDLWLYPLSPTGVGARTRIGTGWGSMRDLVGVGDLDRDGWVDLVAVRKKDRRPYVYLGRGAAFATRVPVADPWSSLVAPLL